MIEVSGSEAHRALELTYQKVSIRLLVATYQEAPLLQGVRDSLTRLLECSS